MKVLMVVAIVAMALSTSVALSNKVIQKWTVPPGVTMIQVTYKDQLGRVLARKDMQVSPGNTFEVTPLQ